MRISGGPALLEVVGLAAGYLGERVIDGIDIEVRTGEAVAIVGSNGAGKTTLFRAIAGLIPSMEGRVVLDGKDLTGRPAHRISRAGIAYVPAERHLFPAMTLKSNLVLGAYPNRPDRETLELVYDLFPRLQERQRQQAGTLSGGEAQMLAVSRALTTCCTHRVAVPSVSKTLRTISTEAASSVSLRPAMTSSSSSTLG